MDQYTSGSTMSAPTVTMDKINPKDCQVVETLGDFSGFDTIFLGLFQVILANPVLVDISKTNSSTQIKH